MKALGVTRLLLDMYNQSEGGGTLIAVRLAGRFAALEGAYSNRYANWEDVTRYDLSSGKATDLDGATWDCDGCSSDIDGLDFLALDSSGFVAWRKTRGPAGGWFSALSCPSASLCVAGDSAGNIFVSSDPVGGPDAWNIAVPDQYHQIVGVSCLSISMCVAADSAGNIFVSSDPTGGQSAWTKAPGTFSAVSFSAVSCPSVTLCVAVGGPIVFTSIRAAARAPGAARSLARAATPAGGCHARQFRCAWPPSPCPTAEAS